MMQLDGNFEMPGEAFSSSLRISSAPKSSKSKHKLLKKRIVKKVKRDVVEVKV
jgi:hypothetical protein